MIASNYLWFYRCIVRLAHYTWVSRTDEEKTRRNAGVITDIDIASAEDEEYSKMICGVWDGM